MVKYLKAAWAVNSENRVHISKYTRNGKRVNYKVIEHDVFSMKRKFSDMNADNTCFFFRVFWHFYITTERSNCLSLDTFTVGVQSALFKE